MARTKAFIVVNNTVLATLPDAIQIMDGGALLGGYVWCGRIGAWNAVLMTTTDARLTTFDTAAGAGCVTGSDAAVPGGVGGSVGADGASTAGLGR